MSFRGRLISHIDHCPLILDTGVMRLLCDTEENIRAAADIILSGGVVAHATETCYGLACDLTNPVAVEKLFSIKRRPFDQPVSALFPSVAEAKQWVEWNEKAKELAKEFLPGPLTLILPMNQRALCLVPRAVCASRTSHESQVNEPRTLGLRVSSHPVATALAKLVGRPISTTSANLHGKPNPYSAEEVCEQYQGYTLQPDLVLDSGKLPQVSPSKIIDLTNGMPKTLRDC